jgi:hypothetical protein
MVLVMLVALLGFAALTVDTGYVFNVRAELQNTADAAALAGASGISISQNEVLSRAHDCVVRQRGMAEPSVLDEDIYIGRWDPQAQSFTASPGSEGNNAVRVITRMSEERGNPVRLFFASILGIPSIDISAKATASFGTGQPWNVVITQDITASFQDELDEARLADQALLDCIRDNTSGQSQVGIVGFTGFGAVLSPLKQIGDEYDALSQTVTNIDECGKKGMPKCSGTNIGAGVDAAIGLLEGLESEYPPAIIVVSDGMPNSSLKGYSHDDLRDWAIDSVDHAHSLGISVFILFYGGNDTSSEAADYLTGLKRGKGTAHVTLDPAEMAIKLEEMCRQGLPLLLVE